MLIRRAECRNGRIVLLPAFLFMIVPGPVHATVAFLPMQYLTMPVAIGGWVPAAGEIIDCNENGIDDAQDIADLTSPDCNQNGIPDECESDSDMDGVPDGCDLCPKGDDHSDADGDTVPDDCDHCDNNIPGDCDVVSPILAPPPHDILKNRYISIEPHGEGGFNFGVDFHIRVRLVSSLVNGVTAVGSSWWAAPPDGYGDCLAVVTTTKPTPPPNWDACPTLHLFGCPIIPTSTYEISAVVGGLLSGPPLVAGTQAKPGVKWHGDCVGRFDGTQWTPPNGAASIDDAFAAIKTFQQDPLAASHVSVMDVHPVFVGGPHPNRIVGINDVAIIILGFQGFEYAAPDISRCP